MSEANRNTFMRRTLIAVLAIALVFTMMPLFMGKVFAEGEAPAIPDTVSLTVKDVNGEKESTLTKEDFEGMNVATADIESVNSRGTVETSSFVGVTVEDILKAAGIEESTYDIEKIVVTTSDRDPAEIPVNYLLTADANGQKAMYIWSENGEEASRIVMGAIEGMDACTQGDGAGKLINKSWWQKNVTGIEVTATKKAPVIPETVSLTVKDVNGEKESTLTKEDFEGMNVATADIESVNSRGTVETSSFVGVTVEDILKAAGIEESTYDIEKIVVTTSDRDPAEIPVNYLLTADANGQKAMYIWSENGEEASRIVMGAIEGMDACTQGDGAGKLINKSWWQKNVTGIEVTATKKVVEPTKVANTLKVTSKNATYKVKTLKKKAKTYKALTVKNAKGTVTYSIKYKNSKAKKALKFNKKTGKITVKKKTKKGTYMVTITVKAAGKTIGEKMYTAKSVKKTITVKVK